MNGFLPPNGHTNVSVAGAPIAVCGMALRLPSGVNTPQKLWEFLLAKRDARSLVPESRYNASAFYDTTGKPATIKTQHGYFLDEDIGSIDASFFSMTRMEVERADPQQRLLLEVARECFEDACETNWRGKTIGCFVGNLNEDWCEMFAKDNQQWGTQRLTGIGDFALSNRVSYEMDLRGPSMTIRTACSASLVALHQACTAIVRGDCVSAIVGGTNLMMAPNTTMSMSEQGVLSPDGSCNTFSAEANGYARGEAITVVYLKTLSDAIREGNPIRAVISGTATNHDGKTPGMTFPSAASQEAMMRKAYQTAGIPEADMRKTCFVECHGTGTPAGDPVEISAVTRVFGVSGTIITSIKPNFGHTEGSSGLLSLIKAVLALEHRIIPPNIKFATPNPAIPFEASNLTVPTEPIPWPEDRLERVSVNSFGIGGTNAHAIVDSAASYNVRPVRVSPALNVSKDSSGAAQLLVFSATSANSLTRTIENHTDFIAKGNRNVDDIAFTLANGREHLPYRAFAIANGSNVSAASPIVKIGQSPSIIMVFTGQGAQWSQMGRELLHGNARFLETIRQLDEHLRRLGEHMPNWSIEGELSRASKKSLKIFTAELSQPLCTAVQIALVDALEEVGIKPNAVVGHSSGEIAAAYASHALTKEEAITAALYRGIAAQCQKRRGAMAAIGMSVEDSKQYLVPSTVIACDNSYASVTISGDSDGVETVLASIRVAQPDVLARKLQVDKAYHSYHMDEIAEDYLALMQPHISGRKPRLPFFSSLTGKLWDESSLDSGYWRKNLQMPVLFRSAVNSLLQDPVGANPVFLEIGPHSTLAGPLRQILSQHSTTAPYVTAMVRGSNCLSTLLSAVGRLYTVGIPMDFRKLMPTGSFIPDLPRYPWNHEQSYWYESRLSKEHRHRTHPYHDLLGSKIMESTDLEPSWRNMFHLENVPWIREHRVQDDIVFPFAGYIAIAGEAIRQISGIEDTVRVRHMVVKTALVITEGRPAEIITTCRPHRLTDSTNSQWWDFTISAHNGISWTKYCTGQVMAQTECVEQHMDIKSFPRKVGTQKWFDTLRRSGLDLGPGFRNLESISASATNQEAHGRLLSNRHADVARYHIHPATVDSALQLLAVASAHGEPRRHQTWLPVLCEDFTMKRCSADFLVNASTNRTSVSSLVGNAIGVLDGTAVLCFHGLKLSPLEKPGAVNETSAARCTWAPDIDFLKVQDLIKPSPDHIRHVPLLEELGRLCILHSHSSLQTMHMADSDFAEFRQWIYDRSALLETHPFKNSSLLAISEKIHQIVSLLADSPAATAARALERVCFHMDSILSGAVASWEAVLSSDVTARILEYINECDMSPFIRSLAHCTTNMRILEIGTWRRSPSPQVLDALKLSDGSVLCAKYVFTSRGFISPKEYPGQKDFPKLQYLTLDPSSDPTEQGLTAGEYDLIMASSAGNRTEELVNIKKLLRPHGRLLLQEPHLDTEWIGYLLAFKAGQRDRGPEFASTFRAANRELRHELAASGFAHSSAWPLRGGSSIFTLVQPHIPPQSSNHITVLLDKRTDACLAMHRLEAEGYVVDSCTLEGIPPAGQDVVSLLDMQGPFFENISPAAYEQLQAFLLRLDKAGIFWITKPSQFGTSDPRYAQVIGAARTIRSEMLIDFATCEMENFDTDLSSMVHVLRKFQVRQDIDVLKPDFEYIIRNGIPHISRFYPFSIPNDLTVDSLDDSIRLHINKPGRLSTLGWARHQTQAFLQTDEVEIEMHSVGMNFRDVLVAMGLVETGPRVFGYEGAGVIRRVGSDVTSLSVGDRVAVVQHYTFATTLITPAMFCVKIPNSLDFDQASTMFIPYMTALHSLSTVGGLFKGQSVLIHSACGGVGYAAVKVAQMLEAEVYVTVGTDEKVQFVIDNFGIARNRIFNSRNESFVSGVKRETDNRGVDIVLNSLAGDLLHASWNCVAPFGRLVEIGKRDLLGFGKLDMSPFLANRSYCCVDLDGYGDQPVFFNKLLTDVLDLYQRGFITPVQPIKVYNADSVYDAFRYMQPGQHIGRISVSLRNSAGALKLSGEVKGRPISLEFDSSASYLLVGGLGGLGRSISSWMVEHGARHLIYLSRSATLSPDHQNFMAELHSMGCQAELMSGSVTNYGDVQRAIKSTNRPVKGVLQMSMVLRDESFSKMTMNQWNEAVVPKVQGTWNLHQATLDLKLDFFVLFSSLSGTVGQPGQANYASANTFLDAFVQMRARHGLPASAIDLGAVGEIGFLSENARLLQEMTSRGFVALKEREVLDALKLAILPKPARAPINCNGAQLVDYNNFVVGIGTSISPGSPSIWHRDRRMGVYHSLSDSTTENSIVNADLKAYIASARNDPSILKSPEAGPYLAREIGKRLFLLLLKHEDEVNILHSLQDLGMDSLVGIELRIWWKQVFGFDTSVLKMLSMGTLEDLGKYAADSLLTAVV